MVGKKTCFAISAIVDVLLALGCANFDSPTRVSPGVEQRVQSQERQKYGHGWSWAANKLTYTADVTFYRGHLKEVSGVSYGDNVPATAWGYWPGEMNNEPNDIPARLGYDDTWGRKDNLIFGLAYSAGVFVIIPVTDQNIEEIVQKQIWARQVRKWGNLGIRGTQVYGTREQFEQGLRQANTIRNQTTTALFERYLSPLL